MPFYDSDVIAEAKQMDLLTYLQNYEPQELVHVSGNAMAHRPTKKSAAHIGGWYIVVCKKFRFAHLNHSRRRNIIVHIGGAGMDYMTLKEASKKWGISPRMINYYCASGRISGSEKMGTVWLIPKSAEKPADGRKKNP